MGVEPQHTHQAAGSGPSRITQPSLTETLPTTPDAPSLARTLVRSWLSRAAQCTDEQVANAELLVSELVSNAIKHTSGPLIALTMTVTTDVVRISIEDSDARLLAPLSDVPPAHSGEGGRGLWLVHQLADKWGSTAIGSGGKAVWFELACREASSPGANRT
jgi:anti-sigma regulatory factor (Ser/Thr protein kinase)